jgi:hypothetical protein
VMVRDNSKATRCYAGSAGLAATTGDAHAILQAIQHHR